MRIELILLLNLFLLISSLHADDLQFVRGERGTEYVQFGRALPSTDDGATLIQLEPDHSLTLVETFGLLPKLAIPYLQDLVITELIETQDGVPAGRRIILEPVRKMEIDRYLTIDIDEQGRIEAVKIEADPEAWLPLRSIAEENRNNPHYKFFWNLFFDSENKARLIQVRHKSWHKDFRLPPGLLSPQAIRPLIEFGPLPQDQSRIVSFQIRRAYGNHGGLMMFYSRVDEFLRNDETGQVNHRSLIPVAPVTTNTNPLKVSELLLGAKPCLRIVSQLKSLEGQKLL